MQLTINESTAKALRKAIEFLAVGTLDTETHTRIEDENLKTLGVTVEQMVALSKLAKKIDSKLETRNSKNPSHDTSH